jgi:hypothetical protein
MWLTVSRTLADVPTGEKTITTLEARRRLHRCQPAQLRAHVLQGSLTPYREHATGQSRVYYLESEVEELAKRWKPKKRRRKRAAMRHRIAAKVLPLIEAGWSFEKICFETLVHPDAVQEIIESLKLGPDGAPLRRAKQAQETLAIEQDRIDMQTRRAAIYYDLKRQQARQQHELDRRLERLKRKIG